MLPRPSQVLCARFTTVARWPQYAWRWSQSDRDTIGRSVGIFGSQLEAAGLGSFKRLIEFEGPTRLSVYTVPATKDYTTRWVVHGCMLIRGSA
jgi:hypothetical protein